MLLPTDYDLLDLIAGTIDIWAYVGLQVQFIFVNSGN